MPVERPRCRLCGVKHWSHEVHQWTDQGPPRLEQPVGTPGNARPAKTPRPGSAAAALAPATHSIKPLPEDKLAKFAAEAKRVRDEGQAASLAKHVEKVPDDKDAIIAELRAQLEAMRAKHAARIRRYRAKKRKKRD